MTWTRLQLKHYLWIAAILQIVWGLTPSASKLVIDEIPVELYIALRWTISGLIFSSYLFITRSWQSIASKDLVWVFALGLLGYGVGSFGTLYGLKLGGVTNFALMAALSPIVTSVASIVLLQESPTRSFYIALPMSVAGLICLVVGKYQVSSFSIAGISAMLILGAYVCEALVFVSSKRFKARVNTAQYLAVAQLATGAFAWGLQFALFRQVGELTQLSGNGWIALGFVSVVACVLCFAILYWLLGHVDGHKLALFEGLHTVSAVAFGFLFFNERLGFTSIVGGGLVLGALLVSYLLDQSPAREVDGRESD